MSRRFESCKYPNSVLCSLLCNVTRSKRRRGAETPRLFGYHLRGSVSPRKRHRPVDPNGTGLSLAPESWPQLAVFEKNPDALDGSETGFAGKGFRCPDTCRRDFHDESGPTKNPAPVRTRGRGVGANNLCRQQAAGDMRLAHQSRRVTRGAAIRRHCLFCDHGRSVPNS
jgi:hypothetical protein